MTVLELRDKLNSLMEANPDYSFNELIFLTNGGSYKLKNVTAPPLVLKKTPIDIYQVQDVAMLSLK